MTDRSLLALLAVALPAASALVVVLAPHRLVRPLALASALPAGGSALALAALVLHDPLRSEAHAWWIVDAAGALFVGTIGLVALASAAASPAYLDSTRSSLVREPRRERTYFTLLFAFWAVLAAVPLAGNLGAAWLLVEATTALSAVLVGFSGKPRALEAGWKYLILTSLGLGVALLGIVLLAAGSPGGRLAALSWHELGHTAPEGDRVLVAYVLLLAGLACKVGWAPVHNWLPDAHSEAPPPVSALLSAALLPAVALVAWRSEEALSTAVGVSLAHGLLGAFGLLSIAVAVPFLWRALAWKRLLAYSSLEHMGVLALGIAFATPLALAGVAVHLVGHAIAKALGFYAATPLLEHDARASRRPATGVGRDRPLLGASLGIALGSLAALPPSPLFVSEALIVAGGFQAGRPWAAAATAFLLALGFLGLAHALLETTAGEPRRRRGGPIRLRALAPIAATATLLLAALTVAALWLPGSDIVAALLRGIG